MSEEKREMEQPTTEPCACTYPLPRVIDEPGNGRYTICRRCGGQVVRP